MAIDPNDFDVPVKDYAFNEVVSTTSLLDQMAQAADLLLQNLLKHETFYCKCEQRRMLSK